MNILIKTLFLLCVNALVLFATFDEDIANIAEEIAENLKLSTDKPLFVTTLSEDKQYMLPLEPVFNKLKTSLKPYVSDIRFKNPQGSEVATLATIIRDVAPLRIEEMTVDSLILTGSYFLMDQSLDRVNCILKSGHTGSEIIPKRRIYHTRQHCPPAIKEPFQTSKQSLTANWYKGYVIDKLERLFNAGDNDLLLPPAVYSFVNRHPYAIQYQVNALKEILTLKYGVSFSQDSNNKIVIPADGSLIFIRDGKERPLQKIIDGEPLYSMIFQPVQLLFLYEFFNGKLWQNQENGREKIQYQ